MQCACERCGRNAETLGMAPGAITQAAMRRSYRAAARKWHPDRFQNDEARRVEAEEVFKRIQSAYSELREHLKSPALPVFDEVAVPPAASPAAQQPGPALPTIFFGGIAGCYAAPHFPAYLSEHLIELMHEGESAVGVVELSRRKSAASPPPEFVLFTSFRMIVRSEMRLLSMLWYTDLGEIRLMEREPGGMAQFWRRMLDEEDSKSRSTLEICRRDGPVFYTFSESADDSMKKVVYNFLRKMKQ